MKGSLFENIGFHVDGWRASVLERESRRVDPTHQVNDFHPRETYRRLPHDRELVRSGDREFCHTISETLPMAQSFSKRKGRMVGGGALTEESNEGSLNDASPRKNSFFRNLPIVVGEVGLAEEAEEFWRRRLLGGVRRHQASQHEFLRVIDRGPEDGCGERQSLPAQLRVVRYPLELSDQPSVVGDHAWNVRKRFPEDVANSCLRIRCIEQIRDHPHPPSAGLVWIGGEVERLYVLVEFEQRRDAASRREADDRIVNGVSRQIPRLWGPAEIVRENQFAICAEIVALPGQGEIQSRIHEIRNANERGSELRQIRIHFQPGLPGKRCFGAMGRFNLLQRRFTERRSAGGPSEHEPVSGADPGEMVGSERSLMP